MRFSRLSPETGDSSSFAETKQQAVRSVREERTPAVNISRDVRRYIEHELVTDAKGSSIGPDDDLLTLGIIDSLGLMRLVSFLEESYSLTITDSELTPENFRSVSAIAAFVAERTSRGTEAAQRAGESTC